jgi:tRNA(Arg) A34 adenosine deaminase TadA
MCATAIQRAGIGRVVFALSSTQLQGLRPDGFSQGGEVIYEGPALYDDARTAIGDYYFRES